MESVAANPVVVADPSKRALWTGRVLSCIAVAFLLFDAVELAFGAAYLVPRTAVLGAIVWTAYLGGAVATHVRAGSPLFGETLFPVYFATLMWLGLWLRDRRLRSLVPLRS